MKPAHTITDRAKRRPAPKKKHLYRLIQNTSKLPNYCGPKALDFYDGPDFKSALSLGLHLTLLTGADHGITKDDKTILTMALTKSNRAHRHVTLCVYNEKR